MIVVKTIFNKPTESIYRSDTNWIEYSFQIKTHPGYTVGEENEITK